jgi:hypothetical protein
MKGAGFEEATMQTTSLAALTALGLIFAPAAWAANDRTPASQQRAHKPLPAQPQQKRAPQNSCDYDRAAGNCMIDLGYGRCMSCDAGPAK